MLFLLFFSYQHAKCPFSIYLLVYLLVGLGGLELLLDAALTASCVHSQAVSPRGLWLAMRSSLAAEILANIMQVDAWDMMITEECLLFYCIRSQSPMWWKFDQKL